MTTDVELTQDEAGLDLRRYLDWLFRRAWLIVLCTVLAAGAAYLVSRLTRPVYSASATLLINQAPSSMTSGSADYNSLMVSERLAGTYVELLRTSSVLDQVLVRLGLPLSSAALAARVQAQVVRNTQLIRISVEDTNPQQAARIANTLAQVFQAVNEQQQQSRYASLRVNLEAQTRQIEQDIVTTQVAIEAMPATRTAQEEGRLGQLQAALAQYRASYASLLNNLAQVRLAETQTTSNVIIVQEAAVPAAPIRPRTLNNTLLAAVVGALLAAGVVLLIEYLDDTVKTPDDLERVAHTPLLGLIARIEGSEPAQKLIAALTPRSPISEAYRVLRTNIQYSSIDRPLRTLLVTSSNPTEGKSTTVANLAVVLAQAGKRVLVVDTDLRRPMQHKFFGLPNAYGVTTALLDGRSPLEQHLQATAIENLRVMTSGPLPPNPAELLGSQRMGQMLEALAQQADLLVLDSPPLLTVTDATLLSRQVDGTLLVVDAGNTRRALLARALATLQAVGAPLLGVVLNRIVPSRSGYYSYYYYYYYYDTEDGQRRKRRHQRAPGRRWPWQRARPPLPEPEPAEVSAARLPGG